MPHAICPDPDTVMVGEFTLNLATGELERAGVRTRLQDKPFQVLRMLIERSGELVTREQLRERLWPQGYVEFEMGLNTAVRKLRTALGDHADAPRYIETLPRRGYRLLAAVSRSRVPAGAAPDSNLATPRRRWWMPTLLAVVALGLASLLADRFWWSRGNVHRERTGVTAARSIVVLPFVDMCV